MGKGEVFISHFPSFFQEGREDGEDLKKPKPKQKRRGKWKREPVSCKISRRNSISHKTNNCHSSLFSLCTCKTPVKDPPCVSVWPVPTCTVQIQPLYLFSVLKSHFIFSIYTENPKHLENWGLLCVQPFQPESKQSPRTCAFLAVDVVERPDERDEEPHSDIGCTLEMCFLIAFSWERARCSVSFLSTSIVGLSPTRVGC